MESIGEYAKTYHAGDSDFVKYSGKLTACRNREGILIDARSITPISLTEFDKDRLLLNV
ncbi:MAG: hypothetical protein LBQ15_08610 [Clostridium sp.]|nr:hypothetical protein [Clostridium sp.]